MIWVIIVVVLAFIVIPFLRDTGKQAKSIKEQGGMRNKYKILVDEMLAAHPSFKILEEHSNFISVGGSNFMASIILTIQEAYGNVVIYYDGTNKVNNQKTHQEWKFPADMDQNKMLEQIANDSSSLQ